MTPSQSARSQRAAWLDSAARGGGLATGAIAALTLATWYFVLCPFLGIRDLQPAMLIGVGTAGVAALMLLREVASRRRWAAPLLAVGLPLLATKHGATSIRIYRARGHQDTYASSCWDIFAPECTLQQ